MKYVPSGQSEHDGTRSQGQTAVNSKPRKEGHAEERESDKVSKQDQVDNMLIATGKFRQSSITVHVTLGNTTTPATTGHSDTCEEERCASQVGFSSSSISLSSCVDAKEPPASLDESDAAPEPSGSLNKTPIAKIIGKRKTRIARRSSSAKRVAITPLPSELGVSCFGRSLTLILGQVFEFKAQSCQVAEAVSDGGTTSRKPQLLGTRMRSAASLGSLAEAAVRDAEAHACASSDSNSRKI